MEKSEFLPKLKGCIERVGRLAAEEFYVPNTARYHPVRSEIAALVTLIDVPQVNREAFFNGKVPPDLLLPKGIAELEKMSTYEIAMRLRSHNSAERWADGMLVEPFETGVYLRALELLYQHADTYIITATP
jgi:hypothetical protein